MLSRQNMRKSKNIGHIVLGNSKTTDKTCFLVGALNLNLIDCKSNVKIRDFVNLIFQHSLVSITY